MNLVFIPDGVGTGTTFCLTMIIVAVLGVLDGIVEGSFTGLALYLPEHYYQVSGRGEIEWWCELGGVGVLEWQWFCFCGDDCAASHY